MEFVDEQLEARQQQQKLDGEAITVQPSSLYTVTDLNKLLHLQGVRFYTDVWTSFREVSSLKLFKVICLLCQFFVLQYLTI